MTKKDQLLQEMDEDLREEDRPIAHTNHRPILTRRDLFARGFYSFASTALLPGILTSLSKKAYGITCSSPGLTNPLPFIVLDLGGGANFAMGNVIVGKDQNQRNFLNDAAVATLGCPPEQNPKNNSAMAVAINDHPQGDGLLFHANSGFLAGFRSATSATTRAKLDGIVFCSRSADDTANNTLNPVFWMQAAGARGELVDIIGNANGSANGRSQAPSDSITASKPIRIRQRSDAMSLVDGGYIDQVLPGQAQTILKAAQAMSSTQLRAFQEKTVSEQVATLVECGYLKATDNLSKFTPDTLNFEKDPIIQKALQTNNIGSDNRINNAFQVNNSSNELVGTLAKMILDGYAGAGTITMGGYDYHNQGRRLQTIKDFNAGRVAGLCFEMAALKNKPLVMSFITDGGVVARGNQADNSPEGAGRFSFVSDSGTRSSSFMLAYSPQGVISTGRRQVGSFQDSGAVDQAASPISNNQANVTKAMAANYMALVGNLADFNEVVRGRNPFGSLDTILGFRKIDT